MYEFSLYGPDGVPREDWLAYATEVSGYVPARVRIGSEAAGTLLHPNVGLLSDRRKLPFLFWPVVIQPREQL